MNPLRYSDFEDFKSLGDIVVSPNKLDKTGKRVSNTEQHKSLTTINQKFFEPGRSCMECDSMQSATETVKKKTQIHVPR